MKRDLLWQKKMKKKKLTSKPVTSFDYLNI